MKNYQLDNIISILNNSKTGYLTFKQIAVYYDVKSSMDRQQLDIFLKGVCSNGQLRYDKYNNRYSLPMEDTFLATVDMNARGYCFLIQDNVDKDLFVSRNNTNNALHKDTVLARRVEGTVDEAVIVKVISRGMTEVVGTLDITNGYRFVIADDNKYHKDVFIPKGSELSAKHGQKVVTKITSYPMDNSHKPEGVIVQVLGYPGQHNADMLSVAYSMGIKDKFPDNVISRASKISSDVSDVDIVGRQDYREQLVITIDGDDAKDLDDAISISRLDNGNYRLGVHIADVSHYVKVGDDIDVEAYSRGTSTYLPDMVFPMLPVSLSNGICSLFQHVDRLTLSCNMTVDTKGEVVDFEVVNSVINSRHRMTYSDVQGILDGNTALRDQYRDIVPMLEDMSELASILIDRRDKRGNINFASKEVKFISDNEGKVVDIVPYPMLFSNRIIEQFMVLANETVARYASDCNVPFMYRVHEKPDTEKLKILLNILQGLGINIPLSHAMHSTALQRALIQCEGKPYYNLVNAVMLRTMQKAKYSDMNDGHYGLASECYCHFTSPIRRYPDLVVHRILKILIAGKMTDKAINAYRVICEQGARECSINEKKAEEAERKAVDIKVCQFASTLVGNSYSGVINGMTENGIFVELANTIEGFVRVDSLGNNYHFDKNNYLLFNNNMTYRLGDVVDVIIDSVNVSACRIDMIMDKVVDKAGRN